LSSQCNILDLKLSKGAVLSEASRIKEETYEDKGGRLNWIYGFKKKSVRSKGG